MIKFYIDIDGCLRDLVSAIDRLYKEQFPTEQPVNIPVYDISLRYPRWGDDTWDICFRQHVDRLFEFDAESYPGAIEAVNWLNSQDNAIVKLLSKQDSLRQPPTDRWLDKQGLDEGIERIYVTDISKGEYLLGVDDDLTTVFIDDSPDEFESVLGIVDYPILIIRDWNRTFWEGNPGIEQITNIDEQSLKALLSVLQMGEVSKSIEEDEDDYPEL